MHLVIAEVVAEVCPYSHSLCIFMRVFQSNFSNSIHLIIHRLLLPGGTPWDQRLDATRNLSLRPR